MLYALNFLSSTTASAVQVVGDVVWKLGKGELFEIVAAGVTRIYISQAIEHDDRISDRSNAATIFRHCIVLANSDTFEL